MPHRPARSQLTPRAVLYLRVSTEEQTVGMSLAVQERDCRQWCERQGIAVDRVFIEPGESAKTDARPAFQAMVAHAKAGGITQEAYVAKDAALRAELAAAKQQGGQALMTDGEIEAVMIEAERILANLPAVSNRLDRTGRHALMRLLWPRGLTVGRDGVRTAASGCVFADLTSGIPSDSGLAPHAGRVSNLLTIYRQLLEIAA